MFIKLTKTNNLSKDKLYVYIEFDSIEAIVDEETCRSIYMKRGSRYIVDETTEEIWKAYERAFI